MAEITGEAAALVCRAEARGSARAARAVPVDYRALDAMVRRQRARLTRAMRSGDPNAVVLACRDAVAEWNRPGSMWPDDWSRWQRALDDATGSLGAVQLEDLA
jgi:hypothetical protein